jgi:peptide/nickel transport system permease protein
MKGILANNQIVLGGAIMIILIVIAMAAPLISSPDYSSVDMQNKLLPPGDGHLLGTDAFGRDLWTRLAHGARVSLLVSLMSVALACACGTLLGLLSGYFGGCFDLLMGRLIDIMMAFPALLLSILIGTVLGTNMVNLCFAIGIPLVPSFYRTVRSTAMMVKERYFVRAALSMGSRSLRIILKHILPNALPQIFVMFSFSLGGAIMAESSLGFLGLGIPSPTPSWGLILNEGHSYFFSSPWLISASGTMIALTVWAFNMMGDGFRDHLDPKLKR